MNYGEALPLAEQLYLAMAPFCERISIAGSIRRQKSENIKDLEIVCIPKWEGRIDPADLFGERIVPTNLLHDWAMSDACPVVWIKSGEGLERWTPDPAGKYWRAILPQGEAMRQSPINELATSPKVDIFITEKRRWGSTFLIRTGAAEFGAAVLGHAKRVGYQFDKGEVLRDGQRVDVPEEEDVFRLLGLRFVEPQFRFGPAQVVRDRNAGR